MKTLFASLLFLFLVSPAAGQTWYTANQVTFAWDPVPKVQPTDQTNKYQVYSRTDTVSNGVKVGGEITATQLAVSFTVEGRYYLGVEAIRYPAGETVGIVSATKGWSNVAVDAAGGVPFGVVYFVRPGSASGLRITP
jgi:hypothetical protein